MRVAQRINEILKEKNFKQKRTSKKANRPWNESFKDRRNTD